MTSPKLYHIKHPLSNNDLPEQTLATFTDQDVADYKAEFKVYQSAQNDCVRDLNSLIDTCRNDLATIFGSSSECKQVKYFDRMVRSGETVTDVHAMSYARPETVKMRVEEARKKYSAFMGSANTPKVSGDDSLKEINNAVSFLMGKGMTLNSDFTISNAVSMAKASFQQYLNDNLIQSKDADGWSGLTNNIIMSSDGAVFPTSSFAYTGCGVNELNFKAIDINLDTDTLSSSIRKVIEKGTITYDISFSQSQTPTLVIL